MTSTTSNNNNKEGGSDGDNTGKKRCSSPNDTTTMTTAPCHVSPQDQSIFLAGRYCKYGRNISQSPWIIDGCKKVADSVEDFVKAGVRSFLPHTKSKFSASGREDVDVRMLGTGRPFVLEVCDASHQSSKATSSSLPLPVPPTVLSNIEEYITSLSKGRVTVRDLQVTSRREVSHFQKEGLQEKRKQYIALVCISPFITKEMMDQVNGSFTPTTIRQKTPIRVLHRRPLATRERTIESLHLLPVQKTDVTSYNFDGQDGQIDGEEADTEKHSRFLLRITTQEGTYIKEFVHSDLGRTSPSLADIIGGGDTRTDIISLDVEQVFVDWPIVSLKE